MYRMVVWVSNELNQNQLHPLMVIGLFIYEFLSIHPFQDSNGRLSRLLTTLLLLRSGYEFAQYVSFETIIEQHKVDYYSALMSGQQYRGSRQEVIGGWMLFFLSCLETLIERLETKYVLYQQKGGYLNERQEGLLRLLTETEPTKIGDLATRLPKESINTLKKDLRYLVKQGLVERLGELKASVYVLKVSPELKK